MWEFLNGFEQDLYRIKITNLYKEAENTTEIKFIAQKGKTLVHTEFYPSDADMCIVAIHLRKYIQKGNVISIYYIKDNIIDKLPIDYKEEKEQFYKIYDIFNNFLYGNPVHPMKFNIGEEKHYHIDTVLTVFNLLWYGDIIHRSGNWESELISLLRKEKTVGTTYLWNLYSALSYTVYILELILKSLKNLYKKIGDIYPPAVAKK